MNHDPLRYDRLVETALRSVVREALLAAAPDRMPGDHHFFLTFRTRAPGVDIPDFLLAQYPEEMTIVLQHQYWGLKADDEHFEVTLSFNNIPADLYVPFAALTAFIDPSVKFGLQFNVEDADADGANAEAANGADKPGLPVAIAPVGEADDEAATDAGQAIVTAPSDEAHIRAAREAAARRLAAKTGEKTGDGKDSAADEADEGSESADIVNLDSFRKK